MPINDPALDSRRYREILTALAMTVAFALTMIYPDLVPLAIYVIQPGASAMRDSSIPVARSLVNAIIWGIATYALIRVSERLKHKNR